MPSSESVSDTQAVPIESEAVPTESAGEGSPSTANKRPKPNDTPSEANTISALPTPPPTQDNGQADGLPQPIVQAIDLAATDDDDVKPEVPLEHPRKRKHSRSTSAAADGVIEPSDHLTGRKLDVIAPMIEYYREVYSDETSYAKMWLNIAKDNRTRLERELAKVAEEKERIEAELAQAVTDIEENSRAIKESTDQYNKVVQGVIDAMK